MGPVYFKYIPSYNRYLTGIKSTIITKVISHKDISLINTKVCSKGLESISRFAYNFFIFHPISTIYWQSKSIAENFMLSEKCFVKNENKCEKNENENLQLL